MKRLSNNLLIRFSVISFVTMFAIGTVLSIVLTNNIRSKALEALTNEAVGASSGRLLNAITPEDLKTPMTGERYDEFHRFVQQSIVSDRTARVKLWGTDGTVIYSNDPAGVGERFPEKPNFLMALQGKNSIEIKIADDAENARERFLGTLMEVYTPIVFPGASQPYGVLEIYQYYGPTAAWISDAQRSVIGIVGAGFLILYGGLVSTVWGGWRTINRQQAQLAKANAELRTANITLEHGNRELQEFASVAAHDLQEPLRKLQVFGDRVVSSHDTNLSDEGRRYLARMQHSAGRMQTLINDLLTYSGISTRGRAFDDVDLHQVAEEVLCDLQADIDRCGGSISLQDLPEIHADPVQMRNMLQILVGNALKFHKDGCPPDITISGQLRADMPADLCGDGDVSNASEGYCWLSVQDNGIGFDEKYGEQIFTIFERLHSAERYGGNGVGLAICRKIVERHGGRIHARSSPGEGATFEVVLPVRPG